jgi:hypothetical protein
MYSTWQGDMGETPILRKMPTHVFRLLLLVLLFLVPLHQVVGAAEPKPIHEIVTGAPDVFPISFWCGPPRNFVTVERYQQVKDAGFTFIFPDCVGGNEAPLQHKILDTAHKVGLKAFVDDSRMPRGINGSAEAKRMIDTIVAEYSTHPAFAGYYISDEPGVAAFPALAETFAYLREKDPHHPAYTNLMPNWARLEHTGVPTYEEYVERFMATVKPPVLSYDHYGFFKNSDRPGFFANIELIRAHALRANIPFWNIVQATSHGDYRRVTEAEKRWEAMHTLAYGAKGLLFFTYWEPDADPVWDEAIIALDGTPTRQYAEIQRVNRDVQAIGKHLLRATSLGVMQQGRPGDQTHTIDDLPVHFGGPDITCGYFKEADGDGRLMLFVNRDYRNPVDTFTMVTTDGKPLERLDRSTGQWVRVAGKPDERQVRVRLQLPPGDAELYRW